MDDKGRHFKSRFIKPGLAGYPGQFGNALIQKETLDRFVHTLRNKPVIIGHKDKIKDEDKAGEVFNIWFNPEDGWYWCDGIITDKTAQNLIENKGWSVSCAYDYTKADTSGGTENNIPYDIEFLDGEFNHLALVDNPRYEGANIVFNSKDTKNEENKKATIEKTAKNGTFLTSIFTEAIAEVIVNSLGEHRANNEKDGDKWITIKPHGEEAADYKRLKLKSGETPKEAMKRVYGIDVDKKKEKTALAQEYKENTGKQKESKKYTKQTEQIRELVKQGFDKKQYYEKLDAETNKLWKAYTKAMRETTIYWDDSDEAKKIKKEKLDAIHDEYAKKRDERSQAVRELNAITSETQKQQVAIVNSIKENINIEKSLKAYDSSNIDKKIKEVIFEYDIQKLNQKYTEVDKQLSSEKNKWLEYINSASTTEEQNKRVDEYDKWYKESDIKKEKDELFDKIAHNSEYRYKAISQSLQIENGSDFKLTTTKGSKLTQKVNKTNELLSGIIEKNYLPDFSPFANGQTGRANAAGNIINITSKDSIGTYIHESMHWLEKVNPEMLANSMAFLEYRTKGEAEQNLKRLTKINYKASEYAKPDKFFNPYCGKVYDNATEIMSMGVQRLFEHPKEFMEEDKEYFNFVIANLQGKI